MPNVKGQPGALQHIPRDQAVVEALAERGNRPARPIITIPSGGDETASSHVVAVGRVRFESYEIAKGAIAVEADLGDGRIKITGGYGGIEKIARPNRLALTEWNGSEGYSMDVPIILDRFRVQVSVEPEIGVLEQMAREPGGDAPPPVIRCVFPGGRPRSPRVPWLVENIDWQDDDLRNNAGARVRQSAIVQLTQFVADDRLERLTPSKKFLEDQKKRRARRKRAERPSRYTDRDREGRTTRKAPNGSSGRDGSRPRFYTMRAGETLSGVAKRLDVEGGWHALAALNGIRDPEAVRKGQRIRLP